MYFSFLPSLAIDWNWIAFFSFLLMLVSLSGFVFLVLDRVSLCVLDETQTPNPPACLLSAGIAMQLWLL